MARPLVATLPIALLLAGLAGCVAPTGNSPGPDNPQLAVYRTEDLATQIVVRGAFKDREYDRIDVLLDGAGLVADNHTYLASEKVNRSAFNLTVRVVLGASVYAYDGAFLVLKDGVQVLETTAGAKPETKSFPFTRILEKEKDAGAADA